MNGLITDNLITPDELVGYLQISKPTLYRLTSERKISYRKVGGLIRFSKIDIDLYLEKSLIKPLK